MKMKKKMPNRFNKERFPVGQIDEGYTVLKVINPGDHTKIKRYIIRAICGHVCEVTYNSLSAREKNRVKWIKQHPNVPVEKVPANNCVRCSHKLRQNGSPPGYRSPVKKDNQKIVQKQGIDWESALIVMPACEHSGAEVYWRNGL